VPQCPIAGDANGFGETGSIEQRHGSGRPKHALRAVKMTIDHCG